MRCSCCNQIQSDEEIRLYDDLCENCWHIVVDTLDEWDNDDDGEQGIYTDPSSLFYTEVQRDD